MTESSLRARLWAKLASCFGRILFSAIAWSLSASRAFARPVVLVGLLVVLAPVCVMVFHSVPH